MERAGDGELAQAPTSGAHHLVRYVQHTRRELRRAVEGMSIEDLERRLGGLNSIAWIVGHLGWQEQTYWLTSRGEPAAADLEAFGHGEPAAAADFETLYQAWQRVTAASDLWLAGLDEAALLTHVHGRSLFERENVGTLLTRVIGHYYLHIGQITAIRKLLGYPVPTFVGSQAGAMYE